MALNFYFQGPGAYQVTINKAGELPTIQHFVVVPQGTSTVIEDMGSLSSSLFPAITDGHDENDASGNGMPLTDLPYLVLAELTDFLDQKSLRNCRLVSKRFCDVIQTAQAFHIQRCVLTDQTVDTVLNSDLKAVHLTIKELMNLLTDLGEGTLIERVDGIVLGPNVKSANLKKILEGAKSLKEILFNGANYVTLNGFLELRNPLLFANVTKLDISLVYDVVNPAALKLIQILSIKPTAFSFDSLKVFDFKWTISAPIRYELAAHFMMSHVSIDILIFQLILNYRNTLEEVSVSCAEFCFRHLRNPNQKRTEKIEEQLFLVGQLKKLRFSSCPTSMDQRRLVLKLISAQKTLQEFKWELQTYSPTFAHGNLARLSAAFIGELTRKNCDTLKRLELCKKESCSFSNGPLNIYENRESLDLLLMSGCKSLTYLDLSGVVFKHDSIRHLPVSLETLKIDVSVGSLEENQASLECIGRNLVNLRNLITTEDYKTNGQVLTLDIFKGIANSLNKLCMLSSRYLCAFYKEEYFRASNQMIKEITNACLGQPGLKAEFKKFRDATLYNRTRFILEFKIDRNLFKQFV